MYLATSSDFIRRYGALASKPLTPKNHAQQEANYILHKFFWTFRLLSQTLYRLLHHNGHAGSRKAQILPDRSVRRSPSERYNQPFFYGISVAVENCGSMAAVWFVKRQQKRPRQLRIFLQQFVGVILASVIDDHKTDFPSSL